jgi:hypothetical protein
MILGTAAYMSPEQARGKAVDKRADIWAFGVVLYEMLTGKQPFHGDTVSDILAAVLKEEPDCSRIPAKVQPLLRRCLVKDPKQRLRDIGDAMPLLDGVPAVASARRAVWPGATAVLSIGLAVIAAVGWWRATRPVARPLVRISAQLTPAPDVATSTGRLDPNTLLTTGQPGTFLALSPDGMRLAVSLRDTDGKVRLATRRLDQSQFASLPGAENASGPFFSPDGQWIAFFAEGKLKKIPVQGGAPVMLCDAGNFASGSWGDDGNIIAALSQVGGLSGVPSAGGSPTPLTKLNEGEDAHRFPQVLPGGREVLFTATTGAGAEDANIEILSLKTRERKTVVRGGFVGRYLATSNGVAYLVYLHQNTLFAGPFDLGKLGL